MHVCGGPDERALPASPPRGVILRFATDSTFSSFFSIAAGLCFVLYRLSSS